MRSAPLTRESFLAAKLSRPVVHDGRVYVNKHDAADIEKLLIPPEPTYAEGVNPVLVDLLRWLGMPDRAHVDNFTRMLWLIDNMYDSRRLKGDEHVISGGETEAERDRRLRGICGEGNTEGHMCLDVS